MKYSSDINEIPLSVFIEVYTNPKNTVEFEEGKEESVKKLITDYIGIVSGRQVANEVGNKNKLVNLTITLDCMLACENLIRVGDYKGVCNVLASFGYGLKLSDEEKIKSRVLSIKAVTQYEIDKLSKKEENQGETPDKNYFVKERVSVMKFYKMHIDPKVFTAGEYANLVKQMCDEIEELNRKMK